MVVTSPLLRSGQYTALYVLYWHSAPAYRKPSCQSMQTIQHYSDFLYSIHPLLFFLLQRLTERLLILFHCSLIRQSWLKSPPANLSIIHIDMFHSGVTSWGATETRKSITTTWPSHHPPAVATSNRIFLNVRRVSDGAGCLIMTQRTAPVVGDNAIISCVTSPSEDGNWSVLVVCYVSCISRFDNATCAISFFQQAVSFSHTVDEKSK